MKKEEIPICPKCKKNDRVVKCDEQSVEFRLFIAKPLDDWYCVRCEYGFKGMK